MLVSGLVSGFLVIVVVCVFVAGCVLVACMLCLGCVIACLLITIDFFLLLKIKSQFDTNE